MNLSRVFAVLIVLNSLGSVAVFGVPVQWIGLVVTIVPSVFVFDGVNKASFPFGLFLLLFGWASFLNLGYFVNGSASMEMPPLATTSYTVFIGLRFLTLVAFFACVILVLRICQGGRMPEVSGIVVTVGAVVALYAIYVYFAQLVGLPEPLPRSRVGTGGGAEQATTFSYAFHRAMGSFREPAHLAEWLMVPFAMSFIQRPRLLEPRKLLMGACILLTGSLTGVMSLLISFGVALSMVRVPAGISSLLTAHSVKRAVAGVAFIGGLVAIVNWGLSGLLVEIIAGRTLELVGEGMTASNRGYIYEYVSQNPFPWIGHGLGNSNLAFAGAIDNPSVTAFLSLYFNTLYSTGIVGFVVMVLLLVYPLRTALRHGDVPDRPELFFVVWGYVAWLVAFAVHSEELSWMFGVAYAMLLHVGRKHGRASGARWAVPPVGTPWIR